MTKDEMPVEARYLRRFSWPVSTTNRTFGRVTEVSATFVATTTTRLFSGQGPKGASCARAGNCAYSGRTWSWPSPKPAPWKTPLAVRERSSLLMRMRFCFFASASFASSDITDASGSRTMTSSSGSKR